MVQIGASCKTPRPRKIEDFEACCEDRLADPCNTDGGLPRRAGEEVVTQDASKGRFCEAESFATGS
jgi:hypothetical protein